VVGGSATPSAQVLDVAQRLVEQARHVRIMQPVDDTAAGADADHEPEVAQDPQLMRDGWLLHLDRAERPPTVHSLKHRRAEIRTRLDVDSAPMTWTACRASRALSGVLEPTPCASPTTRCLHAQVRMTIDMAQATAGTTFRSRSTATLQDHRAQPRSLTV
jgi:hypothetical protein